MNLQLDNKLALVTASTGGIGREIARTLAREGATVIVNGRSASSVEAAIAATNGAALRVDGGAVRSVF